MTEITIETHIKAPVELCFDLALDVHAHAESAAFSGERLIAPGRLTGTLQLGDLVCFEGRHFGIRHRFCARIIELERPRRFVDRMEHGIFRRLEHIHEFHPAGTGTIMRDILRWEAPLGAVGRIADAVYIKRHMSWFVRTKQHHLKRIVERRLQPRDESSAS